MRFKALHRTAICDCVLPWGFSFIRHFVAVGELVRRSEQSWDFSTGGNGENGEGLDPLFSRLPPVGFGGCDV